jgi:hypothetical protein
MSEPKPPMRFKFSPLRILDWLDTKPESMRRIGQGLIIVLISGIVGLLWQSRASLTEWIAAGWNYFIRLVNSPIQIVIWKWLILFPLPFFAAWLAIWVALKDRKIKQLEDINVSKTTEDEKRNAHDIQIFRKIDNMVNEQQVQEFYRAIYYQHFYRSGDLDGFLWILKIGEMIGYNYLDQSLQSKRDAYIKSVDVLLKTITTVFFNNGDGCYQLYPELKHNPEKRHIYEDALTEVKTSCDGFFTSYVEYRKAVKDTLYI